MNMPKRRFAPEVRLILLAAVFLSLGVLVYVFDRSIPAYFLPAWLDVPAASGSAGLLGGSLPALVHTLALILVTAAVLWPWPRSLPYICGAWFLLECGFEICQMPPVDHHVAALLPRWFDGLPVLDSTGNYFIAGTFDYLDIAASGLGAFIAYLIVRNISLGARP